MTDFAITAGRRFGPLLAVVVVTAAMMWQPAFLPAMQPPQSAGENAADTDEELHVVEGYDLTEQQREQAATIAVMMLAGILFVGAVLIGLVLLWGFRMRRMARRPLPKRQAVDPLWYLKPEKPRASQERVGESDDDESEQT